MKSLLHHLMVDPLQATARRSGASAQTEAPVRLADGTTGYIDLVVTVLMTLLAIEVELTPDRVLNDLLKALALPAGELWIVTPDTRVARRVVTRLGFTSRLGRVKGLPVAVLTFGHAQLRLARLLQSQPPNSGVKHHA